MMATVITENMVGENYGAFEKEGFMKSLVRTTKYYSSKTVYSKF